MSERRVARVQLESLGERSVRFRDVEPGLEDVFVTLTRAAAEASRG